VGLAGAGVGGGGAVALKHDAGLPAGDPHKVALGTTLGEPLMSEGMAQLVGVQSREARSGATTAQHHHQPLISESALLPQPQPRQGGMLVADASAQVAVQRLAGPAAKRQGPLAAALAEDQEDIEVKVDIVKGKADHLGTAGTGVQQQHDQRGVAAALEAVAGADAKQPLRPSSGTIGTGLSGTIGGFIRAIG
jgi:hypothetical protein